MAGTMVSLGVAGALAAVTVGLVGVGAAAAFSQRLAAAADAAALAAADAASGAASGDPCARAAELAQAIADAEVASCELDGLVVTVRVTRGLLGLPASAAARAGPPP